MKNFEAKGKKVYVPSLKKVGTAMSTDIKGNIVQVEIDGEIVDTANKVVQLWELLSWFYKLIVSLFVKKK